MRSGVLGSSSPRGRKAGQPGGKRVTRMEHLHQDMQWEKGIWPGVGWGVCGGGGGTSALHFIPLGKTENTKTKDTFASPAALSFLGGELFLVQAEDFSVFFFFLVPWKFLVGEFASWRNSGICYRECQPQSHSDSDRVTFPHAASRWPSFLNLFFRGAKEL